MTLDELRGHVADVLATPLSDGQTLQELRSRVNGADLEQLLVAALSVAREQSRQIVGLENTSSTTVSSGASSLRTRRRRRGSCRSGLRASESNSHARRGKCRNRSSASRASECPLAVCSALSREGKQ